METFLKDPDAFLDYGFDWSEWLDDDEDIDTSDWIVEDGITEDSDEKSLIATTIWLSGGVVGGAYLITNRIVTTEARGDDRSFYIKVRER